MRFQGRDSHMEGSSPAWRLLNPILGFDRIHLITGGLGNQMFQHAFAMALQSADGARAAVDGSRCGRNSRYVGYEIDKVFTLEGGLPMLDWARSQFLYRIARACGDILTEKNDVSFTPRFLDQDIKGYVQGFFPSYRYFSHAEARIRKAFQFRKAFPIRLAPLAAELAVGDAVAVHVRRGDYLIGDHAKSFTGICTKDYYRAAISFVRQARPESRFYFFTDDPAWCHAEFSDVACVVIEGNLRDEAWLDMALMSRCRHAIIANSSFSWWGRWLGGYGDAVCVGPSRLMNDTGTHTSIEDFLQPCFTIIDEYGAIVRTGVA